MVIYLTMPSFYFDVRVLGMMYDNVVWGIEDGEWGHTTDGNGILKRRICFANIIERNFLDNF